MKVIDMCDECGTYEDLVLQEGKKTNKFGKMYYLKEKICLVQRKPSTDYNEWVSDKGEKHLRLGLTAELKKELMAIEDAATAQIPSLDFKGHDDGNVYIKFGKNCPTTFEENGELQYTIQVYGCFPQNLTGKSFLQMDIMEQQSTRESFLNKAPVGGLSYEPNSKAWDASSLKF